MEQLFICEKKICKIQKSKSIRESRTLQVAKSKRCNANKQAQKNNRNIACLLQMHIAEESTKFGLDSEELFAMLNDTNFKALDNITIKGLMGMATFTDDEAQIRKEFQNLRQLYNKAKELVPSLEVLSMGMSGDYKIAIEEGSTMVRIGSSIFGARNYS